MNSSTWSFSLKLFTILLRLILDKCHFNIFHPEQPVPFPILTYFTSALKVVKQWHFNARSSHERVGFGKQGLLRFRGMLKQFYHTAACTIFNSDDPRTWKSVCPKCKSARILSNTLSCCNWDIFAYRAHCNCLYQLLLFI